MLGALKRMIATEYNRHDYLATSEQLTDEEHRYFGRIASGEASKANYGDSLRRLVLMLAEHHQHQVLALAYLTGVQRISKETIFNDLNNLVVNTALSNQFDEQFGFTEAEVAALIGYLGYGPECLATARQWYDGYRFGRQDVYNPWSMLNFLDNGCAADNYWGNTSSNGIIGDMLLMGLCFGISGYGNPLSNREAGYGRYDIRLNPALPGTFGAMFAAPGPRPVISVEMKYVRPADGVSEEALTGELTAKAREALQQITDRQYDASLPDNAQGASALGHCDRRAPVRGCYGAGVTAADWSPSLMPAC